MEVLIGILKEVVPFIKDWGALIIAGISLLVAIISLFKSSKAQRLQNKVNELELKIKQNELDKIAKEKEDSVLACVEARFITVGKGKHRLKVWNSGNATAYNVSARFDGDVGIMIRFLYKGIIINQNKKLSQPTLKRRFFKKKAAFFSWPGLGKEWC